MPVIGSPRQGGMELCGRSRAGSIKWATTPPGGGHDTQRRYQDRLIVRSNDARRAEIGNGIVATFVK